MTSTRRLRLEPVFFGGSAFAGALAGGIRFFPSHSTYPLATVPMAAPADTLAQTLRDRYTIERELGRGGMAMVYLARDLKHDRLVALKVMRPEVAAALGPERFLREIKLTARLDHPHIVPVLDSGENAGLLWYTMPYVEGESLRDRLRREVRLPFDEAVRLGREVAEVLAYAHQHSVVHRDIKPENILLSRGHVRVADFGIARALSTAGGERLTETGMAIGTLAYMSPEQAGGEPLTSESDLFSLGVVLYELSTGRHPFPGKTEFAVLGALMTQPPVPPSSVDPSVHSGLEELILGLLEKDPRRRPAADEVVSVLTRLARGAVSFVETPPPAVQRTRSRHVVGRARERAALDESYSMVAGDRGTMVTVGGEPGIGKTTLVETFLESLPVRGHAVRVGRGRCSERLAGTEAYLPLVEAVEDLLRAVPEAAGMLRRLAPSWHDQVQVGPRQGGDTEPASGGVASQGRLKRELAAFLRDVSHQEPTILFLEDVHWVDVSTTEMLAFLAGRFDELRVLVLATYRPSDLRLSRNPFGEVKLDLQSRGLCRDLQVEFLAREEVEHYLALEFPGHDFPPALAALVHEKTEGSPLFMVDLLRYLRDRGVIAREEGRWRIGQAVPLLEAELPESVRSMIQRKIDRLDEPERRLLTAASVQGHDFDSAILAKALALDPAEVEDRLEGLEQVHAFVRRTGERELPSGELTVRYRFIHVLYQNALYGSLAPSRRARLSAGVAHVLRDFYRGEDRQIAAELALLFEAARQFGAAADYFLHAAQNAFRLYANREALELARRGLGMLQSLPESPERARRELELQLALGLALGAVFGAGTTELERVFARARELGVTLGERRQLYVALRGLSEHYQTRAELDKALAIARDLLPLAEQTGDAILVAEAHHAASMPEVYLGHLRSAFEHARQGALLDEAQGSRDAPLIFAAVDCGVGCRVQLARAAWLLGYPDQAVDTANEAIALADRLRHPYSRVCAREFAAMVHQFRREPVATQGLAEAALSLGRDLENSETVARSYAWLGWALARQDRWQEGIDLIRSVLDRQELGINHLRPHFCGVLADALLHGGEPDEALAAIELGLGFAEEGGRYYAPELHRLKGECLLAGASAGDRAAQGIACFETARTVARAQGSRSFELRAAVSLAKFLAARGSGSEANQRLIEIYGAFVEGHETPDLSDARNALAGEQGDWQGGSNSVPFTERRR